MREHRIRHLPVFRSTKLVGVVSERDLGLVAAVLGCRVETVAVEEVMSRPPLVVRASESVAESARAMAECGAGSAVVVDRLGVVTGIMTTTDALFELARPRVARRVRGST
jgi:CBS domain-containing protein